jgi:uncharacterized membrane protein (DUF4010 family)
MVPELLPDTHALLGIFIGAGVGLAVGLERGWHGISASTPNAAGIRTFTLTGLLGGLVGWLQVTHIFDLVIPGFLAVALFIVVAYALEVWRGGDAGMTTEFALLIVFVLGVVAGAGYWLAAAGVSATVALILGLKTPIHNAVAALNQAELLATLQLLLLAVLIVPLLPNHAVFGLEGFNPRTIGYLTLLISAISYLGYFSLQLLGHRKGTLLAALLGGLTASTAVTLSFARLARHNPSADHELNAGVSLACAVMAPRLLVVVGLMSPVLVWPLAWSIWPLLLVPLVAGILQYRLIAQQTTRSALKLTNPLALGTAFGFALLLAVMFIAVPFVESWGGSFGLFLLAALSGMTDVDAISLSLAGRADASGVVVENLVDAIVIAAASNSLFKAGLAWITSAGVLRATALVLAGSALLTLSLLLF